MPLLSLLLVSKCKKREGTVIQVCLMLNLNIFPCRFSIGYQKYVDSYLRCETFFVPGSSLPLKEERHFNANA